MAIHRVFAPVLAILGLWGATCHGQAPESVTDRCADLMAQGFVELEDAPTRLTSTRSVEATDDLPAYCRVEGYVAPQVWFEIRLPLENWNRKFLMQGCGGMCGWINMEACEDALARNYAVANTDMGHKGPPASAFWAKDNREAEIQFGFRATHVVAVAAKAIVAAFYGTYPERSYFRGCSTGGRQGLMSAQRFPHDFDGIIAGAPVIHQPGTAQFHLAWLGLANLDEQRQPILTADKVPLIQAAVMAACDAEDGVRDGVLMDPRRCDWDPDALRCGRDLGDDCLSDAQVEAVRRLYSPARNSKGQRLFPGGMMKGSEHQWAPVIAPPRGQLSMLLDPNGLVAEVSRYLAFDQDKGRDFSLFDLDFDEDYKRFGVMASLNTANDPDLREFAGRGGKLILYHGWDDLEIPPLGSVEYYEDVVRFTGSAEQTQEFFRLFMLPGVAHCRRGPGADAIDYLSHLEDWVERGKAPEYLTAHHLRTPQNYRGLPRPRYPLPEADYDWTRPVFPYPKVARYVGRGNWREMDRWTGD